MPEKKWVKDYLTFTRKDRIASVAFVAIVAGCVFLPPLLARRPPAMNLSKDSGLVLALDTLEARQVAKRESRRADYEDFAYNRYEHPTEKPFTAGELFRFDPNNLSLPDWQRLGLNDRTAKTILKYVSKGGRFYKPQDLQKIWGMPAGFYERVKEYVVIPTTAKNYAAYENRSFEPEYKKPVTIQINNADTAALISLPGIGSKLSARIVAFRKKLGGFYSVNQIGETWGLPDSTFQKIKAKLVVDAEEVRKINVNTATKDDLKSHPYIRWNLANAIIEYRNQHGTFKSLDDLKNIVLVDEATFEKIAHYLSL